MGDCFFMEENYLTRSKIHTKALVVTMDMMLKNRKANLMNYHGIFHHWYEWIHINAQFYENLTYPSRGEHLEVTLARLRASFPSYLSYAKSLLNDLEMIISLYNDNKDFFSGLYANRAELKKNVEAHLAEEEKKFRQDGEAIRLRCRIDSELEATLCGYRRSRELRAKLEELEDKYSITIDPDNTRCWFERSQEMYRDYNERYNAFLEYKGECLTSFNADYVECAAMTAEKVYKVLAKELMDNEAPFVPSCQAAAQDAEPKTEPKVEAGPVARVYLNGDTCQSFYRSGAVDLFLANCSEESFYQLMNLNPPTPETGIKLIYADGLYYVLRILKDFLIDKGQTQDWINGVLESFGKNYKTFDAHSNDVFTDSENEKSGAYKLYPIVKDWLKFRKEA